MVEPLVPPNLTNPSLHRADFLRYLVRCHFPNLLGYLKLPRLVHPPVPPLHQAITLLQIVVAPPLFALVNLQVVAAVLLFVLTAPLMALTLLLPQLL